MSENKNTRREFLTTAAGLAAASAARPASAAPSPAPQRGRVIGANDRINIGMIGVGGRGSSHVRTLNRRTEMKRRRAHRRHQRYLRQAHRRRTPVGARG